MMRKILLISLIILSLFLVGCGTVLDYLLEITDDSEPTPLETVFDWDSEGNVSDTTTSTKAGTDTGTEDGKPTSTSKKTSTTDEDGCKQNKDCPAGNVCIDGECGTVANLYKTEGCSKKCNFNNAVVETSDGQTFTLNRGKGDYTAAGAIEWKLVTGPDYCQGDDIIVPVMIKKKYLGKIVNEQYVTVKVGEKSEVVTHPNMKSIKFTFTVKSVNEECG